MPLGQPRTTDLRAVVVGLLYMLRTSAWLNRNRRLAKDFRTTFARRSVALPRHVQLLVRRL